MEVDYNEKIKKEVVEPEKGMLMLFLYFLKPFAVMLVRCRWSKPEHYERSYFALKMYIDRLFYDFVFILVPAYLLLMERELEPK